MESILKYPCLNLNLVLHDILLIQPLNEFNSAEIRPCSNVLGCEVQNHILVGGLSEQLFKEDMFDYAVLCPCKCNVLGAHVSLKNNFSRLTNRQSSDNWDKYP